MHQIHRELHTTRLSPGFLTIAETAALPLSCPSIGTAGSLSFKFAVFDRCSVTYNTVRIDPFILVDISRVYIYCPIMYENILRQM